MEYRLDKTNIIHTPIGKASFGPEKLKDNFNTLLEAIVKAKPAAAKGQYLRSVTISATMSRVLRSIRSKFPNSQRSDRRSDLTVRRFAETVRITAVLRGHHHKN